MAVVSSVGVDEFEFVDAPQPLPPESALERDWDSWLCRSSAELSFELEEERRQAGATECLYPPVYAYSAKHFDTVQICGDELKHRIALQKSKERSVSSEVSRDSRFRHKSLLSRYVDIGGDERRCDASPLTSKFSDVNRKSSHLPLGINANTSSRTNGDRNCVDNAYNSSKPTDVEVIVIDDVEPVFVYPPSPPVRTRSSGYFSNFPSYDHEFDSHCDIAEEQLSFPRAAIGVSPTGLPQSAHTINESCGRNISQSTPGNLSGISRRRQYTENSIPRHLHRYSDTLDISPITNYAYTYLKLSSITTSLF